MKNFYKIISFLCAILIVSCDEKDSLNTKDICQEKLPPFIEKFDNKFDEAKLKLLCNCIWTNFPEGKWERKASEKLYNGEDIGWKIKSFSTVFEATLKKCKSDIN